MAFNRRRILSATGAAAGVLLAGPVLAQAPGPVRIGSTLALTGPLSATALTHKLVGEIYVEQLNKRGGLLGRQVQWIVKDDQSKPERASTPRRQPGPPWWCRHGPPHPQVTRCSRPSWGFSGRTRVANVSG